MRACVSGSATRLVLPARSPLRALNNPDCKLKFKGDTTMSRRLEKFGIGLALTILCSLVLLTAGRASEHEIAGPPVDPIVGLWNVNLNAGGPILIAMTFNQGGTTVEYDTTGTDSFAPSGESLVQGVWKKTGTNTYTFKEQN